VPSQCLSSIATIQAHHIIMMDGSPYRHRRNQNFLRPNGLSKLTERVVHGSDEIRNLIGCHPMLDDVALDDVRC